MLFTAYSFMNSSESDTSIPETNLFLNFTLKSKANIMAGV